VRACVRACTRRLTCPLLPNVNRPTPEDLTLQKAFPHGKNFSSTGTQASDTSTNPIPPNLNRLAMPILVRGLHVVVKPCNPKRSFLFTETRHPMPSWPFSGAHAFKTLYRWPLKLRRWPPPSLSPFDRRVDAAVPGPRRVAIISGPTGSRRCHRYGTLLKRRFRVHSSRPRFGSGSSSGTPGPGVARELQFKSHFRGEAKFLTGLQIPSAPPNNASCTPDSPAGCQKGNMSRERLLEF
jgi:hypothetical protein